MAIDVLLMAVNTLLACSLLLMLVLSGNIVWLVSLHLRHRREALRDTKAAQSTPLPADEDLPHVLVQIPTYNERHVVRRAILAVAALDWPRDRLHIQLLDDSTDNTTALARPLIAELRRQGFQAQLLHRDDRTGFKAGALDAGLRDSDAEFVAIFDADFIVPPDFLRRCIRPLLADPRIGLVQARWNHLNADESLLTQAQALMLDAHFGVEQSARSWSGLVLPFNGTCGLWRRAAIDEAGGWHADTLTEDLDLSYRAYLAGWRALYLIDLAVPGELPDTLAAWRAQQFRWNKGFAQVGRKLLRRVWESPAPRRLKIAATCQFFQPCVFPLAAVALICTMIVLFSHTAQPAFIAVLGLAATVLGIGSALLMTLVSQRMLRSTGFVVLVIRFLTVIALNTGIALANTKGVAEALFGRSSAFVRTPKKGDAPTLSYRAGGARAGGATGLPELLMGAAIVAAFLFGTAWFSPFLLVTASGFLWVGGTLLFDRLKATRFVRLRAAIQRRARAGRRRATADRAVDHGAGALGRQEMDVRSK